MCRQLFQMNFFRFPALFSLEAEKHRKSFSCDVKVHVALSLNNVAAVKGRTFVSSPESN
jgi:hypothetical protein